METYNSIEVTKQLVKDGKISQEIAETIFPELKESDDERIRRDIITTLSIGVSCEESALHPGAHTTLKEAIFWLKKQDGQKPAWSEEDEDMVDNIFKAIQHLLKENESWNFLEDARDWLKSLKSRVQPQPKFELSEEDAINFNLVYTYVPDEALRTWLKSLKERYTWKPSDLPHWKKSTLPDAGEVTGFNSDYFYHKGYIINYKELFEKLPKDD